MRACNHASLPELLCCMALLLTVLASTMDGVSASGAGRSMRILLQEGQGGVEVTYQAITVTNADGEDVYKTPRYGNVPHGEPHHGRHHSGPEESIPIHQEEYRVADPTAAEINVENPADTEQGYGLPGSFVTFLTQFFSG